MTLRVDSLVDRGTTKGILISAGVPSGGRNDGYVNIGRTHIFYCDAHRTRWDAGSNLFDSWTA